MRYKLPIVKSLIGSLAVCGLLSIHGTTLHAQSELQENFTTPPQEALPRVWWHWMNGNITKDGIYKDLMWMSRSGIGGVHNFDAGMSTPQIVEKRLTYMTPEWKEAFSYATHLADSLGMEMTIPSSPGWSATGGPWVEPKDAMKKLTWREMRIEGGKRFEGKLPEPYHDTGKFLNYPYGDAMTTEGGEKKKIPTYYEDIAVLAVRLPETDLTMQEMRAKVTSSGGEFTLEQLTDGDLSVYNLLPIDTEKGYAWIQYEFPQAQTIKALTLVEERVRSEWGAIPPSYIHSLWASDDGTSFREITKIPVGGSAQQTIDIPVTTAKYFQVRFVNPETNNQYAVFIGESPAPKGTKIYELALHPITRINHFEEKAAFVATHDIEDFPTPEEGNGEAVPLEDVIDLTGKVNTDGSLTWDTPEGRWRILRVGYSLIGKENHPASPEATGLEVDKMDPEAWTRYFRRYLDMYKDASEGLIGQRGIQYVLTDSYEAGSATWTPKMAEEFGKRRGYELTPWLPVLTGQVVESVEESERFLWDWRKTLGELIAENYDLLGKIVKERYDMKGRYSESHENGRLYMVDGMEVKRDADVAMAAIWVPGKTSAGSSLTMAQADIRESASAAHIYGNKLVAAESMTCMGFPGEGWIHCPESLKPVMDTELYSGVNRVVVHTSVHQPVDDKIPGLGLMVFGQWFNRHETWAEQAKAWTAYIARSSYMMQQGRYVADIAYFYGEDNNITGLFGHQLPDIPEGYSYDFINADALIRLLTVKDGRLVTPSGMSYRVLALDGNASRMSLPVLRKLAELANAGAVICGAIPDRIGGRGDTDEFDRLVGSVWGSGRPNVMGNVPVTEAVRRLGVERDFSYDPAAADSLRFVHRALSDGEFYWVNNTKDEAVSLTASFRVSGKRPQVWHPETGKAEDVSYRFSNGRTYVDLDLVPNDAVFVVFSGTGDSDGLRLPREKRTELLTITGPWQVSFQEGRGAPASATFDRLVSYTESTDSGIRYFSGTATYTNAFTMDKRTLREGGRILLDLGSVKNLAEVSVNEQPMGILWKTPFLVDITDALKAGKNDIEVKVTNLWPNRLIGDEQPGVEERITYTSLPFYKSDDPLLPSGLLGPVKLFQCK